MKTILMALSALLLLVGCNTNKRNCPGRMVSNIPPFYACQDDEPEKPVIVPPGVVNGVFEYAQDIPYADNTDGTPATMGNGMTFEINYVNLMVMRDGSTVVSGTLMDGGALVYPFTIFFRKQQGVAIRSFSNTKVRIELGVNGQLKHQLRLMVDTNTPATDFYAAYELAELSQEAN